MSKVETGKNKKIPKQSKLTEEELFGQEHEKPNGRPLSPPHAAAISIDCGGGVGSGNTLDHSTSINQEFGKLGYGHEEGK